MKANIKSKLAKNDNAFVKVVGTIIALLLMIIIGVLVYWETQGSIDDFGEVTETFTGYTLAGSNTSAWTVEVDNTPTGTSATNVTCYNATGGTESYPTFGLNGKTVSVAAEAADEFSQVNVTYTSNMASNEDSTSDMASTIFDLLPIIALAVVASIIIGVIIGFGGSSKRL